MNSGQEGQDPYAEEFLKRLSVILLGLRLEISGFGHSSGCFKLAFLVTPN